MNVVVLQTYAVDSNPEHYRTALAVKSALLQSGHAVELYRFPIGGNAAPADLAALALIDVPDGDRAIVLSAPASLIACCAKAVWLVDDTGLDERVFDERLRDAKVIFATNESQARILRDRGFTPETLPLPASEDRWRSAVARLLA